MNKILLKSVLLPQSGTLANKVDVLIVENRFSEIAEQISAENSAGAEIVDCSHMALLPAFYNAHTHAAMTLLRGYADDMPLFKWLSEHIWPMEGKMKGYEIEVGSRLAVLEMIKSGTVFFADMYWHREHTMKVVEEMGIRASIGVTFAENLVPPEVTEANIKFLREHRGESDRVKLAVMPHAPYTVGEKLFQRLSGVAAEEGFRMHTHLAETSNERESCPVKECSPVELLHRYGVLSDNLVAAHCVHLSDEDRKILADAGVYVAVNPCSNLKLNSGIPDIPAMMNAGICVALGTDGASSNNNLDMREEMKMASLIAKVKGDAESLPAWEALKMATEGGAKAFGLNDAGRIAEGFLADGLLVNLDNERMVPCHNVVSNWVYAAGTDAIDSVICNGRFVMRNRHVDGEEDILREARDCVKKLVS